MGIWPDNLPAVNVFTRMRGQWLMGPGGPYGMNYQSLESVLRMLGIPRKQWPALFDDVMSLEEGALEELCRTKPGAQ